MRRWAPLASPPPGRDPHRHRRGVSWAPPTTGSPQDRCRPPARCAGAAQFRGKYGPSARSTHGCSTWCARLTDRFPRSPCHGVQAMPHQVPASAEGSTRGKRGAGQLRRGKSGVPPRPTELRRRAKPGRRVSCRIRWLRPKAGRGKREPAQSLEVGAQPCRPVVDGGRACGQQRVGLPKIAREGVFTCLRAAVRVGHRPVRAVGHFRQPQRRPRAAASMAPQAGARVETVVGQQPVPLRGQQVDRIRDVAGGGGGDEVIEVDARPAGLDPLAAVTDFLTQRMRTGGADREQPVTVGPRARASAAGLDAEQVIEQRDDEIVVQVQPVTMADAEGDDRQPGAPGGCRGSRSADDPPSGRAPAATAAPPGRRSGPCRWPA